MESLCTSVAAACTDAHTQSRPGLWMSVGMSASMSTGEQVCFIKFLEPPAALSALLCSALLGNVLFARWNIINYMRAFCHTPLVCMRSNSICPSPASPSVCRPPTAHAPHFSTEKSLTLNCLCYAYVKVSLPCLLLCLRTACYWSSPVWRRDFGEKKVARYMDATIILMFVGSINLRMAKF